MKFLLHHTGEEVPLRRLRQRGIALVITLILLSVTAFMTITFLILSQRERGAVSVAANQTDARLAAEMAVQKATAKLLAGTMALNDPNAYDLMVSTNYVNPAGFTPGATAGENQFTNVSYTYAATGLPLYTNGAPVNEAQYDQLLTNLLYDPRPPVFVTNTVAQSSEFRFFLNLARKYDGAGNSIFATNGYLPVIGTDGNPITTGGATNYNFFVGDPEWIGVLERPDQHYSSSNKFIARYAYIVLPAGKTLDLNYIHNYSKALVTGNSGTMPAGQDEFWRDQGVGTWEDNLAAFLTDLNTNQWYTNGPLYLYNTNDTASTGLGFEDAAAILAYRYNFFYKNLLTLPNLALTNAGSPVDYYADGPLMTGTVAPTNYVVTGPGFPGADNPTHYYTMQDLYDSTKTSVQFTNRLVSAGTNRSSYDRYTYYRMLAQLGTDTAPEKNKLNVNYVNVDGNGNTVPDMETNYASWSALQFFTNAAPRMLTNYFGPPAANWNGTYNLVSYNTNNGSLQFNIEVYPTNYYTPAVHRMLQLAANIYEANTNNADLSAGLPANAVEPRFPHVFRPIFGKFVTATYTNICIINYVEETNILYETPGYNDGKGAVVIRDVNDFNPDTNADSFSILGTQPNDIVYGIPLVIGARKGLPNFQELAMENAITVTRKLQFVRNNWPSSLNITATNVMYNLSISNTAGMEAWNSYTSTYPRSLLITGAVDVAVSLMSTNGPTNAPVVSTLFSNHYFTQGFTNLPANTWNGYLGNGVKVQYLIPLSFQVPVYTNNMYDSSILTNCTYHQNPLGLSNLQSGFNAFESNLPGGAFPVPSWSFHQNTRARYMLVDSSVTPFRIVDYVSLSHVEKPVDVTLQLQVTGNGETNPIPSVTDLTDLYAPWTTYRNGGANANVNVPTIGILNQIYVNQNAPPLGSLDWSPDLKDLSPDDIASAENYFSANITASSGTYNPGSSSPYLTNIFYTPYNPTRSVYQEITWEANDPLVHYTVGDLLNTNGVDPVAKFNPSPIGISTTQLPSLSYLTNNNALDPHNPYNNRYRRYQPWGGFPPNPGSVYDTNIMVKDPLITRSDDWQFPTNKLPGVGWLGQVHRGSPWQTVYLKPAMGTNMLATWTNWNGDSVLTNLYTTPWNTNAITNAWSNGWNVVVSSNSLTVTNIDAALTMPTNDWRLFDLFTAVPNDNASRGQLSVNQTNLAAWSAVLSGVLAISNDASPQIIQPAAVSMNLGQAGIQTIVDAINAERATNYNGSFKHLGDILSVPQLTAASPYLQPNTVNLANGNMGKGTTVNDAMLERIPQETLSLMRGPETRFVVYAYGQSLGYAPRSINSAGLCENYQITGETAVRAVIRVDGPVQNPHVVVESFNYLPPNE